MFPLSIPPLSVVPDSVSRSPVAFHLLLEALCGCANLLWDSRLQAELAPGDWEGVGMSAG